MARNSITQWLTIGAHKLTGCARIHYLTSSLAANCITSLEFYEVIMKPLAHQIIAQEKSRMNNLTVLVEF